MGESRRIGHVHDERLVHRPTILTGAKRGEPGIALFNVFWTTALAERIPPEKLSRVSSYDWTVSIGLLPVGYILAGPLAARLGSVQVLLGGSLLAGVALAAGLPPRETRTLERLETIAPGTGGNEPLARLTHRG